MAIDYKVYSSLGKDGCKCAAFHGCSCLYRETDECHFGSAERRPATDRLRQGSVRTQTSATHAKTHRAPHLHPPGLSQLRSVAPSVRPPRRYQPPEEEDRTSRRPTDHLIAIEKRAAAAAHRLTPAAPPNKEGSLARRRPPGEGPARDDDGPIDRPRSRSTPAACPERRPRAPTARRPRRTANWWTASGANGSTASLHQCRRRT